MRYLALDGSLREFAHYPHPGANWRNLPAGTFVYYFNNSAPVPFAFLITAPGKFVVLDPAFEGVGVPRGVTLHPDHYTNGIPGA